MKRNVALICCIVLVLSMFTACAKQEAPAKVEAEPETAAASDVIELTMWYPHQWEALDNWFDMKIEEFNKLYEGKYHLSWESIVRSDSFGYEDKLSAGITSNSLPDIVGIDGPTLSSYAANGILRPIDDLVSEEEVNDFFDATIQQCTYDGKLFGLCPAESSVAIYYNVDMLNSIGARIPESYNDAWTWSEYYEIAKQLTTDTCKGATLIIDKGEGLTYGLQPFWVSNGTDIISEDGTTADGYINSEKGIEAATYLQKFFVEGIANIDPIAGEFGNGNSATWLGGCWEAAGLEANYPDLNWDVTYYPVADGGTPVSPTGDWLFSITNNCKNPEAAMAVISFFCSTENCVSFCGKDYYGQPAARKSSLELMTEYNEEPYSLFKEQLFETGHARPRTPVYPTLTSKFVEGMLDIFTGADVKETLDNVAKIVDEEYQSLYAGN